ncbi:hypothetical protein E2C01_067659 [Portunus trituberculatus]|uniref:Uncharacterized protein n=1 Tax=Portunus trituberculatus TaxID=210409 RepID=A0A5B7HY09_PORTR|nr:hypothetical protein [Portunus trituberculatus]
MTQLLPARQLRSDTATPLRETQRTEAGTRPFKCMSAPSPVRTGGRDQTRLPSVVSLRPCVKIPAPTEAPSG